jgi:Flp pilus assembly pilin Flp
MRHFLKRYSIDPVRRFWYEEDAATAVEYAVMLALILIAVLSAIGAVAQQAGGMWGNVQGQLNGAGFGS